jgi:pimeloyl-ACP methyl ester carboxylesterase
MNLEQWRRYGRTLSFDGHPVQVYEAGDPEAPPLLLIHGFPTAAWDWHRIWPRLAQDYRLIAPDLLGFGFSAKPPAYRYSFRAQADLCEQTLQSAGVTRYRLLAHDYGDTVAQELLARRIERGGDAGPLAVCLLNGGIFPSLQQPLLIQRALAGPLGPAIARLMNRRAIERGLARVFGPQTQPTAGDMDAFWQLIEHNGGRRVVPRLLGYLDERRREEARWVGALTGSPARLLLVDGVEDPVSGRNMTDQWRKLLPEAGLLELEQVGHYPQMEAPEAVLEATLAFFPAPSQ